MSRTRFLLDENTPHAIRDQLLRRKPEMEVSVMGDDMAPALGTPDTEVLRWTEREGDILVSRNRRTLSQHLQKHLEEGGHVPGILLLGRPASVGEIVEDLALIAKVASPEEKMDRVHYLPL